MLEPQRLGQLAPERRQAILARSRQDVSALVEEMRRICLDVAQRGDQAILEEQRQFKRHICPDDLAITPAEVEAAYAQTPDEIVEKLRFAAANIERFHRAQLPPEQAPVEVGPGVVAGRLICPIEAVGCYIPGGRAAYPSTALMTIIPARVAGVERIVACTPPREGMVAHPAAVVAADIAGCHALYKIGGPWAIAAMAFGTETVPRVQKIVGPGNRYVTAAKLAVFGQVDIDSPAGPSEVLILADKSANPRWVAVDMLAQAEHDPDAAAVLVATSGELAEAVAGELERLVPHVPRAEIVREALARNSAILVADTLEEAIAFANDYAPEHLEVLTDDPQSILPRIRNAGSIFLGPFAPVPAGDYASGTNHVLPTGQGAKAFSGLSVDDFLRKPTYQLLTREGLEWLREAVVALAEAEGLPLHARAVRERLGG